MKHINAVVVRVPHNLPAMEKALTFITKLRQQSAVTPQLSSAAQAYLELARRPDPDIGAVADALTTEADDANRIIALANLKLFASHRHSTNLRQALTNLGVRQALILSVACEAYTALQASPAGDIDLDAYGQRICVAAAWGKTLADEFGRSDCAELVLAAMIQDAGLLLIAHGAPETYAGLDPLAVNRRSLTRLETDALKTDHRKTSAWLASRWELPDNVVRTLELGHDLAADDIVFQDRGFYRAVIFCGNLAEAWCSPLTAPVVEQITADAQRYLGISPGRLAELFTSVAAQVPQFAPILGLESCVETDCAATARQFHALLPQSNVRIIPVHGSPAQSSHATQAPQAPATTRAPAPNLLHRLSYTSMLNEEFTQAVRHDWPLSLLLVEIDGFENMNELCGSKHSARIRNNIAAVLSHNIRSSDTIVPLGEDQFIIVLPGCEADMAAAVAQRVVNNARRSITHGDGADGFPVTVSLGVVTLDQDTPFSNAQELSTAARAALEFSTQSGRDRHTTYASIQAA